MFTKSNEHRILAFLMAPVNFLGANYQKKKAKSSKTPKNSFFFQQDERVKGLSMMKTIAKGKCFGLPARQRDSLVIGRKNSEKCQN